MRFTPGLGMNENVKVAISNSLAAAFEIPVPADDLKFCGLALGKKPGVIGAWPALPVLRSIPLEMPRLEPVVEKVPATVAEPPLLKTGVPVKVMPGFPAAMAEARVAALAVVVTVTAAAAGEVLERVLMISATKPKIQAQSFVIDSLDCIRTVNPYKHDLAYLPRFYV